MQERTESLELDVSERFQEMEERIGRDIFDFVPMVGLFTYAHRSLPIAKEYMNDGQSGFSGYSGAVVLYHTIVSSPLFFASGALLGNLLFQ
jgi:hypothetical protein